MISLKFITITTVLALSSASLAVAGEGKDCNWNKKQAAATTAPVDYTAINAETYVAADKVETKVLTTSTDMKAAKKDAMTFDKAIDLCVAKKVNNLQACIDKKTGQSPQS